MCAMEIPKENVKIQTTPVTTSTSVTETTAATTTVGSVWTASTETTGTTAQTSTTQTTSESIKEEISPVTQQDIDAAESDFEKETLSYLKETGYKGTAEELINELKSNKLQGQKLTEREQKIIDLYDNKTISTEKSNEQEGKKAAEYAELLSSRNGTNYEKTSNIIDKYLSENDEKYQSLKTDNEKRKYRDKQIHDMLQFFYPDAKSNKNGSLNLTVEQRAKGLNKLSQLYAIAGSSKKTIQELTKDGLQATEQIINKSIEKQLDKVLDKIDLNNPDKSPDELLHDLAELALAKDKKYNSLTGEEKEKYLQTKIANTLSNVFGMKLTPEMINDPKNASLKNGAVALLKELRSEDKLTTFFNGGCSPQEQAKILKNAFRNNPDLMKNLSPEMKERFGQYQARLDIVINLGKKDCTEVEVYKELQRLNKAGQLNEAQKQLLMKYENIASTRGGLKSLNQKADFGSITSIALLTGKDNKEIVKMMLSNVDKDKLLSRDGDTNFVRLVNKMKPAGETVGAGELKALHHYLQKELGLTDEQIKLVYKIYGIADVNANAFATEVSLGKPAHCQEIANINAAYASQAEVEQLGQQLTNSIQFFDRQQVFELNDGLNEVYASHAALGMETYKSPEDNVWIVNQLAQSENTSDAYKSTLTSSLIEYATPEHQLYYGQELSKIQNAAITEGLAAAEQHVDSSVRQQYSSYVDNAIQNNGYTSEQRAAINQARSTGQTSYERTSSTNSSTISKTSSSSSTTSNSSSSTATKVVNNVSTTQANTKTVAQMQKDFMQTQEQLQKAIYQNDVEQKQKLMEKCKDIIDNIQQTTVEHEVKKAQNAKTVEDIVKISAQATTSEGVEAAAKKLDEIQQENEAIQEVTEELFEDEDVQKAIAGIDPETIKQLKSAGNASNAYSILLEKNPELVTKFLTILARKDLNIALSFISKHTSDMNVIRTMVASNASLLRYLPKDVLRQLLGEGISLKNASSNELTGLMNDLMQGGQRDRALLAKLYVAMGMIERGSDDWQNMSTASVQSYNDEYSAGVHGGNHVRKGQPIEKRVRWIG